MQIINVMATSLDGKIAASSLENDQARQKYGFSSPEDHEFVREQIKTCDAIITGANSMRASGGAWNQTGRGGKFPLWVVLTKSGMDESLRFWRQKDIPRWVVSQKSLDFDFAKYGVTAKTYGKTPPAQFIYDALAQAGMEKVLLFGGGEINSLFYEAGLVNELKITICPLLIGKAEAPSLLAPNLSRLVSFELVASHTIGSHVFLRYSIRNK